MASVISEHPPALPSDDSLYEIVDGQIVEKDVGGFASWLALRLLLSLQRHVDMHPVGTLAIETVLVLDAANGLRRRPDVAFFSAETWPLNGPPPLTGDWAVVPELAVEVLSPNDLYQNVARKLREYFHYGVKEVWLISPEDRLVEVYTAPESVRKLTSADSLETSLIPGWSINIGELIPVPPAA